MGRHSLACAGRRLSQRTRVCAASPRQPALRAVESASLLRSSFGTACVSLARPTTACSSAATTSSFRSGSMRRRRRSRGVPTRCRRIAPSSAAIRRLHSDDGVRMSEGGQSPAGDDAGVGIPAWRVRVRGSHHSRELDGDNHERVRRRAGARRCGVGFGVRSCGSDHARRRALCWRRRLLEDDRRVPRVLGNWEPRASRG
ncbi:MAG: hypothetical protein QOK28_3086 [Actinomycetota bacterium]